MSNGNRQVREELERIYGHICMLHQGLKINGYSKSKVNYKGKSIQSQLTLHHLKPRSKGGKTTMENGAVVCRGCHDYIEQTTQENRERINDMLRKYKECVVEYGDDFQTGVELDMAEIELTERELKAKKIKYNRAKEKRKLRGEIDDFEY